MPSPARKNSWYRALGLVVLLTAGLWPRTEVEAQSFQLYLRNGDRLSGSVLAEDGVQLALSNAILGRVLIPLAQIERRERLTNIVAVGQGPRPTPGILPAAPPPPVMDPATKRRLNELMAAHLSGQLSSREFLRQQAKLLEGPPKPPKPKHWSGEAQMGTDLGFGQIERELYTARLKLSYARAPIQSTHDYLLTYGKTDGELTANRMDGSIKTDYALTKRLYLYSLAGAGYDVIRKIDWRYEVGPGVGYQLVRLTNFTLRVEAGFHFEAHDFEDNREDKVYYHRLAQDLRWNLGTWLTFDEKLEYLPELDTLREYKLRVEANLKYWLRSNLYLNLTVIDIYDTVTAQGVGQNDLQIKSTVGVRF